MYFFKQASKAVLVAVISVFPVSAQSVQIKAVKETTAVPKACESIVRTNIEGQVDITALVKEASCKGSGDMMTEYTYVLKSVKREKRNKGQTKEETRVYEVFMPSLQSGTRGNGVVLLTSRDGVPVPQDELEKERLRAGKQLEKEEKRAAASIPVSQPQTTADPKNEILPVGNYVKFGFGQGRVVLDVHTFLTTCDLTLIRREQNEGREMLVFTFTPRPDAQFKNNEKYILQLRGVIWVDAEDRIVTRLAGWPSGEKIADDQDFATQLNEKPPAIYTEMMRLPTGIWLPLVTRINGADYPKVFDNFSYYSVLTYSEYKRFTTEIKDVTLEPPRPIK